MIEQEYIGQFLDRKMKNHSLPYGLQYFSLLDTMTKRAEISWKKIVIPNINKKNHDRTRSKRRSY